MEFDMDRFNRAHLWIGNVSCNQENYETHFQLNGQDMSQFSMDLGLLYEYDDDFIGILPLMDDLLPIDELCQETIIAISEIPNVMKHCACLGIEKANAIVWYSDSDITFPIGHQLSYGLVYIGEFDTEMA